LKLANNKTYIGSTDNLERRLQEHFSGNAYSTKNKLPAKLAYSKGFESLEEARYMEKYYKSCAGRKKLKELFKKEF